MKIKTCVLTSVIALILLSSAATQGEVRYLGEGHTDLALDYDSETHAWNFHVGSDSLAKEFAPDEVVLKVKAGAQTNVPASAAFSFLGTPNSTVWILPQE